MKNFQIKLIQNNILNNNYNVNCLKTKFSFFNYSIYDNNIYYILYINTNNIIGIINIEKDILHKIIKFNYIEILKKYRNQKIASKMINFFSIILHTEKYTLKVSPYTSDGYKYIKPLLDKLY